MIRKEDFKIYYEKGKLLGEGGFGSIYSGVHKESKKEKAIKIMDKNRVKEYLRSQGNTSPTERDMQCYINAFRSEAENMGILQGKNKENKYAVILDECFENDEEFVIIMEKCDNDLNKHLARRKKSFNS